MHKKSATRLQVNFRCSASEKANYDELSSKLGLSLSKIIRDALGKLVVKHL